ncbi:GAF domain-containing sensor histidine kinase [Sodalinema gerasimenkoae]|uniref:GAF domain-containing sensor histidine kinase n=1 Tax=Sodalinema gerasimenkoae TaxID=2862348 RepID=UPI0013591CF0|nr:ATP-binding protein [Sodalinema gerasimenkoae]
MLQLVQNLQGDVSTILTLEGDYFNANDRAMLEMAGNRMLLFFVYFAEALLGYIFKDWALVQEKMPFASDYKDAAFSSLLFCYYYFYETLMNCAIYPQLSAERQMVTWETIQERTGRLEEWRKAAPDNYQSKCELIQAEQARIQGRIVEAMDYYDRAITSAQTHGFLVEVAIAAERAADFYNSLGREKIANHYLQDAYHAYEYWGATAKMAALLEEHPHLYRMVVQQQKLGSILSSKITISQSNPSSKITVNQTSSRHQANSNDILDLGTVIKATQALSGQICLPELLEQLLTLALENAGAQRGYLLLMKQKNLAIAASGQVESNICVTVESDNRPIDNQTVPVSLIYYVQRTHEPVVLAQAVDEGLFTQDPYIQSGMIQSILCLPILQQGQVLGILYLENNLTQGAFTRDRLEVLQILSAQAAISIENARLYRQLTEYSHHLEDTVGQRTQELRQKNQDLQQTLQELQQTQTQLIQTEKMSSLGQMVAGIAHEINNPVTFISGNIAYAREYFKDLQDLIELIQQEYQPLKASVEEKIEEIELDFLYEDLKQMLASMENGSDRIRCIILGLRNFSRLDESVHKTADLHEGLDNTLLIIQHRLSRSPRQEPIKIQKTYGELPKITCYPSQLNQVFLNILNNAIDVLSSFESQPNPEIQIKTNVTNTNTITIRILDNGPGMSDAVRQKIFDPFFTTKPVGQGTGLGLSISYQIITEQHRGKLECYSQPGEGSEFMIEIPVNRS